MIPAALLIITVPLVAALPAYILRRWRAAEVLIAVIACGVVIAILARPSDSVLNIGGLTIDTLAPVNLLGRVLAVRSSDRVPLMLLFTMALVLFVLGWSVTHGWTFVPLGLGVLSLLSAGLLIRPFVFAALAFEAASALAAVMIQSEQSGKGSATGALRYLILSTLALPAFLGAGYAAGQASVISDPNLQAAAYSPAVILLTIGIGLLFGAFPLFTWTHAVARDAPPLTTAFLASVGSGAATFLFLSFKQDFTWFRNSPDASTILNFLGIATVLFGGVLGWAQRSFGRVLACGLSIEIGITLLLLSHNTPLAVESAAFCVAARVLSLGVMGLGIVLIRDQAGSDEFEAICGMGMQQKWAALAIAVGGMSLAGMPGTAGFVARWTTARVLGQSDFEVLVLTLLAGASVGVGIIRGLMAMYAHGDVITVRNRQATSTTPRRIAFTVGLAVTLVIVLGMAPSVISPVTKAIVENYTFYK